MIGLRGERDDAVDRFERSLQIFGFRYTLADLSSYGRTTQDVNFDSIMQTLSQLIGQVSDEYVLILDRFVCIALHKDTSSGSPMVDSSNV